MEFLQHLAASLKRGRTAELPADDKAAFYTIMPMVIANQHRSVTDLLSGSKFDVNYACGRARRTLLHVAANCGSYECLHLLLKKGSKVNLQDVSGCTPLHLAARNGQKKCLNKLLENKSDVNIRNNEGLTAIHWLAVNGRTELLQDLLQHVEEVDIEDSQGQTALHVACQNGHKSTLQCLLDHGSNINKVNHNKWTPLHFACSHGQHEAASILMRRNAKFLEEERGKTPLDLSVEGGYGETCEVLLQNQPKLFDKLVQSVQRPFIKGDMMEKVLVYLTRSDTSTLDRVLFGLAEQMSVIGHHLLSMNTDAEVDITSLLKCAHALSHLLTRQRTASVGSLKDIPVTKCDRSQSIPEDPLEPLEGLWQLLEDWLILLKVEMTDTKKSTKTNSTVSPTLTNTQDVPKVTEQEDTMRTSSKDTKASDSKPVIAEPGSVPTRFPAFPAQEEDLVTGVFPRVCALINACYICNVGKAQLTLSTPQPNFTEFLLKHLDVLKMLVAKEPGVIFQHFNFLLHCHDLMVYFLPTIRAQHFEVRREWFYTNLKTQVNTSDVDPEIPVLTVKRDRLFHSSCAEIINQNPSRLKVNLAVRFNGEEGMGHGVVREWFDVLSREILNADYALFTQSADGCTFQPNSNSSINPDHLSYFRFAGQAIGLALFHRQLLSVYFTRSFYKHILGIPVSYTDVASIDPEYAKNLQWILDHDISQLGLDLTFSVETDVFGVLQEVDLKPGGSTLPVTDANKAEYVQLVTELRMTRAIMPQINSFLSGFHDYIPHSLVQLFDEYELELLVSGLPDIDLEDWKANTGYTGYSVDCIVIQWFWEVMGDFTMQERVLMLQFVTGSSRVPYGGFANLSSSGSHQQFTISHVPYTAGKLPTASTCINLLKLAEYPTKEELKRCLLIALQCGSQGYGLV
ncbi:E3 ubiquitin-protein ligase HACE1-like [Haliotis rubra]|uniref:E3 ubiquitin-protein ligase HACE1-like n=1 Tax=Haliotis rubra TaxID=36100 RepID=UPI001EE5EA2E|nr:E3 ubiquitin-protein ligase HACE1-like [Haliotis rubra]